MKKKAISAMLTAAMAMSVMTGCGTKNTVNETPKNNNDSQSTQAGAENTETGSTNTDVQEGKVFNIRCWNEEFKSRMTAHYPGYEEVDATTGKIGDVTVRWIITPNDEGAYQNALDEALLAQDSVATDEKVDLFLVEADYALKYVDTDYTLNVINDIGLTQEDMANQFQYTKDIVTDSKGNQKGISWQGCPGTMIYRRDMAKEVFGTDDINEIQALFSNWDTFQASADELKEAGYKVTSSVLDTYRVFSNNVESKWVIDGKINIDENLMKWVDMSKDMVDQGLTGTYDMWSDDWSKGFTQAGDVFCYFGPAWFLDFTLGGHDLDGSWAATVGPQSFYWGGSWICGAAGSDNVSLIKDIMQKLTCDTDIMIDIVKADNDFVNNKPAMDEMANDESYGNKILGGQNPLSMFCDGAENIDLSNLSAYDLGCTEEFQKAMKNYYEGNATMEEALELFYKNAQIKYPELSH